MKLLKKWALIAVLSSVVLNSSAQTPSTPAEKAPKPSSEKTDVSVKKPSAGPFHAKLVAVDKTARTITVGKRTFLITAETKINKSGKPATLEDGVIGEPVSGYIKPNEHGKMVATKVNFGPKAEEHAKGADKKTK